MTLLLKRSTAFALGFGFAFIPAIGPFAAVLMFFARRWTLYKSDYLWFIAALCSGIVLGVTDGIGGWLFGTLQMLAPWLVYKSFQQLRDLRLSFFQTTAVEAGLIVGLLAIVLVALGDLQDFSFAYRTVAQALTFATPPRLLGHSVLTVGALVALIATRPSVRVLSLMLAAFGVLLSGSREAAIGWVVITSALVLFDGRLTRPVRAVQLALLIVMIGLSAGLGPYLGWGQVGFLLDVLPAGASANLIQGSEIPTGDWWDTTWVTVDAGTVTLSDQTLTAYTITKLGDEHWLRLQQVIPLEPGEPYTISTWIRRDDAVRPGIQGWGQLAGSRETFVVSSSLTGDSWRASLGGPGELLGFGISEREGDWLRVFISFIYQGNEAPLYWYVGLAPDQQLRSGTQASFAGFQLERGFNPTPYVPGAATRGLSLGIARIPLWQVANQGIAARPLFGWGRGRFPEYYRDNWPAPDRLHSLPAHTHNLFIQFLFERGGLGLLGLIAALLAMILPALRRSDGLLLLIILTILFMNIFDYTLFHGGVIYPLAAVIGWRSATPQDFSYSAQHTSRQVGINAVLALGDFILAGVAFWIALWLVPPTGSVSVIPLLYSFLLWPAMAWREGLYPGYGLTAPQEFKKHVTSISYAGLILLAVSRLFGQTQVLPIVAIIIALFVSCLLQPLGRGLLKRLLLNADLWGKQVVIIGAGELGQRVALALSRSPLDGLKPLAFFDDTPEHTSQWYAGVPVFGRVIDASTFASEHQVHHAVVALEPDEGYHQTLGQLVTQLSRSFSTVQVVPSLGGIPGENVYTSNLDGLLALEIRVGLYSTTNQLAKRILDLLLTLIVLLPTSALFCLFWVLIRLDSRGPAIYASERIGRRGRIFQCLKFRTMYLDAEARLSRLMAEDEALRLEYEQYHKLETDPRVTRVGRWLRKLSLDELPQIINILRGEMSLVGPRPYLKRESEDIGRYAEVIFEAKPGITGYWQVNGRNNVTFAERLVMEAHYVRNWSIWWDIVLLAQTFPAVLSKRGAK
jgi:Undecaprenyl-phosphate galactose phosphotransferase WbaP